MPLESCAFTNKNNTKRVLLVLFFDLAVKRKAINNQETNTIIRLIKFSNDKDSILEMTQT